MGHYRSIFRINPKIGPSAQRWFNDLVLQPPHRSSDCKTGRTPPTPLTSIRVEFHRAVSTSLDTYHKKLCGRPLSFCSQTTRFFFHIYSHIFIPITVKRPPRDIPDPKASICHSPPSCQITGVNLSTLCPFNFVGLARSVPQSRGGRYSGGHLHLKVKPEEIWREKGDHCLFSAA